MARIVDPRVAGYGTRMDNVSTGGLDLTPNMDPNTPFNPWSMIGPNGMLAAYPGPANYLENMRPTTQQDVSQINAAGGGAAGGAGGQGFGFSPWTVGPDGKKYFADLAANQADFRKTQQGIIGQNQNSLDGYKAIPQQLDLSPLAALADKWTQGGGSAVQGYAKPAPIDQRVQNIQALQKAVQDANLGLSKGDLAYLNEYGNTKDKSDMMKLQAQIAQAKVLEAQAMKNNSDGIKVSREKNDAAEKFQKTWGQEISGFTDMSENIGAIKNILSKGGIPLTAADPRYSDYETAVAKLQVVANRDYAKLGALAGGDKVLLNMITAARDGILSKFIQSTFSGPQQVIGVLDTLSKSMDRKVGEYEKLSNATWQMNGKPLIPDVVKAYRDTYESTKQATPQDIKAAIERKKNAK